MTDSEDVEFRQALPGDEGLFERVAEDVFDHPVDPKGVGAYLAAPGHVLVVALAEGRVVGQCACVVQRRADGRPPELYVADVGVAPSHQRRGAASRMLAVAFEIGRHEGCAQAWVATEPDNEPALALYRTREGGTEPVVMVSFKL